MPRNGGPGQRPMPPRMTDNSETRPRGVGQRMITASAETVSLSLRIVHFRDDFRSMAFYRRKRSQLREASSSSFTFSVSAVTSCKKVWLRLCRAGKHPG